LNGPVLSPRAVLPILGWCAATLASIALASVALLPVVRTAAPGADAPPTGTGALPGVVTAPPPAANPVPPQPSASATSGPPGTKGPTPPASAPVVTADGWTVTAGADGRPVYVKSFRVAGGQAVIRMTENRVSLVTATPNPGYSVQAVQNEPANLAVQFTEPHHYFVIHALWHNNVPFAEVSEVGS
jgi:hypothetical protein